MSGRVSLAPEGRDTSCRGRQWRSEHPATRFAPCARNAVSSRKRGRPPEGRAAAPSWLGPLVEKVPQHVVDGLVRAANGLAEPVEIGLSQLLADPVDIDLVRAERAAQPPQLGAQFIDFRARLLARALPVASHNGTHLLDRSRNTVIQLHNPGCFVGWLGRDRFRLPCEAGMPHADVDADGVEVL